MKAIELFQKLKDVIEKNGPDIEVKVIVGVDMEPLGYETFFLDIYDIDHNGYTHEIHTKEGRKIQTESATKLKIYTKSSILVSTNLNVKLNESN